MPRYTLFTTALLTFVGLYLYPVWFVTFPWTVPVPYMAAFVGSAFAMTLALCREA